MHTGPAGTRLIAVSEGRYLVAYKCPSGIWTIGSGHTSAAGAPEVHPGMKITAEEADAILREDLVRYEGYVTHYVKVPLTQNQFDALVSFVFNVGPGNFSKSTLLKLLNKGQYDAVPAQLLRWTRGGGKVLPGLVKRRHAEAQLWSDVVVDVQHDGPVAQKVDTPPTDLHPVVTHAIPTGAATTALQQIDWSALIHNPAVQHATGWGLIAGAVFMAGAWTHKLLFSKG